MYGSFVLVRQLPYVILLTLQLGSEPPHFGVGSFEFGMGSKGVLLIPFGDTQPYFFNELEIALLLSFEVLLEFLHEQR